MLSGLFAEENASDRRTLWRIGTWGAAAVGAVIVAVLANQSSLGWRRDQLAVVDLARQDQQIQSLTRASENEARRLSSAIDTLNSDRDRLFARVTVLEQGLDSVTGTIAKQNTTQSAAAATPPPAPAPSAPKPATIAPVATAAPAQTDPSPSSFNQAAAALATGSTGSPSPAGPSLAASPGPMAMALPSEKGRPEKSKVESAAKSDRATDIGPSPLPSVPAPAGAPAVSGAPPPPAGPAGPPAPLMAARSIMAPPDPAASKLMELPKTADAAPPASPMPEATSAATPQGKAKDSRAVETKDADKSKGRDGKEQAEAVPDKVAVQHTEFAVDLGAANSIGGLRALWRGLLKTNGELAELRPIIVIREGNTGLGMQLHLAAGPLKDAAAAARICASLTEAERNCETTVFDGQRLSVSADDAPSQPSAKPVPARPSYYRRGSSRHSRTEDVPAKPPEPAPSSSTFSSLFSGKR